MAFVAPRTPNSPQLLNKISGPTNLLFLFINRFCQMWIQNDCESELYTKYHNFKSGSNNVRAEFFFNPNI